jgi:ATP-binding cassette subfamily F protein 3
MWRKTGVPASPDQAPEPTPPPTKQSHPVPSPQPPAPKPGGGRLNPIKLRQLKQHRREIEDEVTRLEVEIADYESALVNFTSADESVRISDLLTARRTDLLNLMAEWEDVAQTIEANK